MSPHPYSNAAQIIAAAIARATGEAA